MNQKTKIKPITLREALTLHRILNEYLPETDETDLDVLEYSQAILSNIKSGDNPRAFLSAMEIMAKKSLGELLSMQDQDRLLLFIECIGINQLWRLNEMLKKVNYGASWER